MALNLGSRKNWKDEIESAENRNDYRTGAVRHRHPRAAQVSTPLGCITWTSFLCPHFAHSPVRERGTSLGVGRGGRNWITLPTEASSRPLHLLVLRCVTLDSCQRSQP